MNIILIISDQHNPEYIGKNNGFTRTPNINDLLDQRQVLIQLILRVQFVHLQELP